MISKRLSIAEIDNLSTYYGALKVDSYSETFSPRSIVTSPSPRYGALSTGVPEHVSVSLPPNLGHRTVSQFDWKYSWPKKRKKYVHEFSRRRDEMSNFESRRNMCCTQKMGKKADGWRFFSRFLIPWNVYESFLISHTDRHLENVRVFRQSSLRINAKIRWIISGWPLWKMTKEYGIEREDQRVKTLYFALRFFASLVYFKRGQVKHAQ